eukprot:gnl/TRDRNA2_/TRDRNA2_169798_c0_seq2.p1 gnl/TRDRNA2_/TRDRNA2_169798_c0~~gnl/TRDRNA2_/TRDRNA2_169798_c0_seq2.p1  ORF type:complete len:177 (+),score=32.45 gnl/TRDRNA2_/TRDRNA2_169798_c0_seq2:31-561(+)
MALLVTILAWVVCTCAETSKLLGRSIDPLSEIDELQEALVDRAPIPSHRLCAELDLAVLGKAPLSQDCRGCYRSIAGAAAARSLKVHRSKREVKRIGGGKKPTGKRKKFLKQMEKGGTCIDKNINKETKAEINHRKKSTKTLLGYRKKRKFDDITGIAPVAANVQPRKTLKRKKKR